MLPHGTRFYFTKLNDNEKEIYNQISDALAWTYAKKLGLPVTAGSNIHFTDDIRSETVLGVYLEKKMESISDYVDAIRNNAIAGLKTPAGRFNINENIRITIPVDIRDGRDRSTGRKLAELLAL